MWEEYAPDPRMRLNLGIRRRMAPLLDNDPRKIMLANALLYSLPGAPIVYYGDEIGMGDNIWLFDRNGVRTPMQWNDRLNAGFSEVNPDTLYAPVIDNEEFSYKVINVEAQIHDPQSLLNKMRHLINVRKSNPIFALGAYEFLAKEYTECLCILRTHADEQVLCLLNLTNTGQRLSLDLAEFVNSEMISLMDGNSLGMIKMGETELELEPYGFLWLLLKC